MVDKARFEKYLAKQKQIRYSKKDKPVIPPNPADYVKRPRGRPKKFVEPSTYVPKSAPVTYRYKDADSYVDYHLDDPDLAPIRIPLPQPPSDPTLIENYGVATREQRWSPPKIPQRLLDLQRRLRTIRAIVDFLRKNKHEYEEELMFVEREWNRRINGFWLYINGKPTWMPGWQYFYCGYWTLDVGLPKYKDRDRKFFVFADYMYKTTEDHKGKDYKRRTVLGINYPKHRREGATYRSCCINYEIISRMRKTHGGIQSMDGESGKKAFREKLVQPWKRLPFFFKPEFSGSTDPMERLVFDVPSERVGKLGSNVSVEPGLESIISYAHTADKGWYDGDKLHFYHGDECGKTVLENVYTRHTIIRRSLSQDNGLLIHGFCMNTSTVGHFDKNGGRIFFDLCKDSKYHERDPITGQTKTGLVNLFLPAEDGMDMFIDIFGMSIINDPAEDELWRWPNPVRDENDRLMGARRYLESYFRRMMESDDPVMMETYYEELRLMPNKWRHCFGGGVGGNGLNMVKMAIRMEDLRMSHGYLRYGFLRWHNGIRDTSVEFVDDVNGRFRVSMIPDATYSNKKVLRYVETEDGTKKWWFPQYRGRLTAGADPFKFRVTSGRRMSKGGGNVYWHRDYTIDPHDKPLSEIRSGRIVCTYLHRPPTPEEYAEDMIMMCVFYGADMFPEINVPLIWDYFVNRGYGGYLKYERDVTGRWKKTPGWFNTGSKPQEVWQAIQEYIENNVHREMHVDFLEQCMQIPDVSAMTDFDLFASVGGSLLGARVDYSTDNFNSISVDASKVFATRKYN